MRRFALHLLLPILCLAAVDPPDTAPGRILAKWMEAFNSGDPAKLSAFAEQHDPKMAAQINGFLQLRENTGGFDLIRILASEPLTVTALVKERLADTYAQLQFWVGAGDPVKVVGFRLVPIPLPPDLAPKRLAEWELSEAIDSYIQDRPDLSGAVLMSRGGNTVVAKAFGMADREMGTPATLDTRFRIGSMNKMFTAVAVLQLVEQGVIDLDAPIGSYLTQYPNANVGNKVTVRHLLTHTGGTGDIFGPEFTKNRTSLRTHSDYVNLYGHRGPAFEPGSAFQYSNYGFVLLGSIIEAVTGQSYYDHVRERVFQPAGMTRTDSLPEEEFVEDRAVGYLRLNGKLVPNTATLPWRGTAAGGGYSTVRDMEAFAQALLSGKLLTKETLAEATKAQRINYGFGFVVKGKPDGTGSWGHSGGAAGMNGELAVYPESGWVVVALSNLDPPVASKLITYLDLRLPQ